MFGEPLFRSADLSAYLHEQNAQIERHVRQSVQQSDLSKTDEEIAEQLLIQLRVDGLVVDFDHPKSCVKEKIVTVLNDDQPVETGGVMVTYSFKFTGQRDLFKMRGTLFSTTPRGEVSNDVIVVGFEGKDDHGRIKQELDKQTEALRACVADSSTQIEIHNAALKAKLLEAVARRRRELDNVEALKIFLQ